MENLADKAVKNFLEEGYSCSESIVKTAIDEGWAPAEILDVATSFSGGMSSGCACGAVTGAQIIIGFKHGRTKSGLAREKAKAFVDEFKKRNKACCCAALTHGFSDFHSPERKAHCSKMVRDCAEILESLI